MTNRVKFNWDAFCAQFGGPNATFSKAPEREELESLKLVQTIVAAMEEGMNYMFTGPSGTGKTSTAVSAIRCAEVGEQPAQIVYFSGAVMTGDNLKVAFPHVSSSTDALRYLIDQRFMVDAPVVVLFDEVGQAEPEFFNAMMEMLSERTVGNVKPKNMIATIMCDNPSGDDYGRLSAMEFAQRSRFAQMMVTAADAPWQRAVAARWNEIDLKKTFTVHNNFKFDQRSSEIANPRVLDQGVIYALVNGLPGEMGLPWLDDTTRVELRDATGSTVAERDPAGAVKRTVTRKYIDQIAEALGVPSPDRVENPIETAVDLVARDGISIYMVGKPGTGKTSRVKQHLCDKYAHIKQAYFSLGNCSKDDFVIPFPDRSARDGDLTGGLKQLTFDSLSNPDPKIVILDEFTRGDSRTTNVANEIVQQGTVNGTPITNLVGVIAINNPTTHMGMELDVSQMTLPQASRFSLSFEIGAEETKAYEWLLETYGEPIAPFIDWHKEAFRNQEQRDGVSARCIERLFKHWRRELPLVNALASVGGERVDAPLGDLMTMLADQPLARLTTISKDVDKFVKRLSDRNEHGEPNYPADHLSVYKAFRYAELSQLKSQRATCVALFGLLEDEYRLKLLTATDEAGTAAKQSFWYDVLDEAIPDE